ncbi:MFS transporter [Rhodoluna limnophila]|uniref:MFS transporter n=1 Tax=Rhodoluna limnophila TaxID=232537 RepID=UPI001C12A32F|nr:MFS transporter [Rhodoluna limnophila]
MAKRGSEAARNGSRRPAWLSRNLFAISWVSLLQDAASEMLYPLMPIFLNSVLGAPAAIVGAIEGAAEGAMSLTKLASAWINRWVPRKVMVAVGYGGAALGKFIIALAGAWPVVMIGRVVDRLGKGLRSAARDAILVQGVSARDRGKVIGFHRTSDTLGAVIGPALALALLSLFDGDLRSVLWIAVIPAVLSTAAVFFIKDNDFENRRQPRPRKVRAVSTPENQGALAPKLKLLIWMLAIFSLANFPDALILLHLSQEGFEVTEVVGLYLLFNIAYASMSFPFGLLADRMKPQHVYALGLVCFSIAYAGFALTSDKTFSALLVIVYGGFAAANDVVGKSWVSRIARDNQQLLVQSRLQGLSGLGLLVAGIWAGLAWNLGEGLGTTPLLISAAFGLVAAAVVSRTKLGG